MKVDFKNSKNKYLLSLLCSLSVFLGSSNGVFAQNNIDLPIEQAELTDAPNVPQPLKRTSNAKVVVNLEIIETIGKLSDNVEYTFWTFGGKVPGKFIRIKRR